LKLQSLESVSNSFDLYVFNASELVERCIDPLEWLDWMRTTPRLVEATLLNNREIVTLFAGYAGDFRGSTPLTYCTVVKPDPQKPEFALLLQWYATRTEAEAGHQAVVNRYER
jgi:hypothetical protein